MYSSSSPYDSFRISETRQRPPERSTQNTHRIRGFRQAAAAANWFRPRIDSANIGDAVPCHEFDNDSEQPRLRLSDDQAWQQIIKITGVSCSSEFQKLDRDKQWQAFIQLKELGASVRQLQRLTGIDRGFIQRAR